MSNNDSSDSDIGFDPLAWMSDPESDEASKKVTDESPESSAQSMKSERPVEESEPEEMPQAEMIGQSEPDNSATEADTSTITSTEGYRVNLADKIDIAGAEQLKDELSNALNQSAPIILVAGEVERADGAALQLLTAFIRKLEDSNHELVWEAPSKQLIDTANILGLQGVLRLS